MHSRSWEAGRTQTTSVLPAIDMLFREAGMTPDDLDAVAVATGPGTFTGLRVGMSIAKGFVLAQDIPLVGIPTLEITAGGIEHITDVVAVLPAGRGRVAWQRFGIVGQSEPRNTTIPELVECLALNPDTQLVCELAEAHRPTIENVHENVCWQHRDPVVLLRLARERWLRGDVDDPVALEPIYLHGKTVTIGPIQDRLKRS